tara:strand:+ start:250 stop:1227 length:978 start_codon:yes stop_codon:yes gene_type:complete
MNSKKEIIDIIKPQCQLTLFGYKEYFNSFIQFINKKKIPNSILLTGLKGSGKSTFIYHIINYLLSMNEKNMYSSNNLTIHKDNLSFKLLNDNIHPNFYLVKNKELEKNIKIDQVRDLLKFLNKTTYSRDLKIVMIDNAENLNLNSSNALLKSLEEPPHNTFFFVIHNSAHKVLDTIKSRCIEFKILFTENEKKKVFRNLINQYDFNLESDEIEKNLYFDTPGNSINYLSILFNSNSKSVAKDNLTTALYFLDKFKKEKNHENLFFLSLFIEMFYNKLVSYQNNNLSLPFYNYTKIIKQINNMKIFNLDEKNILIWIEDILKNESK